MNTNARLTYFNPGQRYVFEYMPRNFVGVCSRRFGKTDGIAAPYMTRIVSHMPRGKSAIYCSTFKQALTRTIPGTISAIERITGWIHGVHFFVGCKAPKEAGFDIPYTTTFEWEHCIHWYNGHVTHMLSQDVRLSANSLTLDASMIDEAKDIRKEKVDQELIPAISGTPGRFEDFPLKKSLWMFTDRPTTRAGMWILDREEMATPDIEAKITDCIENRALMIKEGYPKWAIQKELEEINELRKQCFMYSEYDTIENIDIVREEYIRDMYRILPRNIFNISILNIRQKRQADGFYSAFDPEEHCYTVNATSEVDNMRRVIHKTPKNKLKASFNTYDFKRLSEHNCFLDADIDPLQSLNIALDYNANINWIVTGQKGEYNGRKTCNTLSSMFVKNELKLREACENWCNYYEPHRVRNSKVNFYYNQTAKQKKYANNRDNERFYETVEKELKSRGWHVNSIDMGEAMGHMDKFSMLDDAFKGVSDPIRGDQKYLYPMFNKENNEFLIAGIENTGIKRTEYGFGKDKSGEKKPDTEDDPAELRTDGTDAFDDLFIGMNKFYREGMTYIPGINFG